MSGKTTAKDLGFAETLATVSIRMVYDGPCEDVIKAFCHEQDIVNRWIFCLAVAHTAMANVSIKLNLSTEISRKIEILAHLRETFISKLGKQSGQFHIGTYIVDPREAEMIKAEFGSCDFTSDMKGLLTLIYGTRVREYESGLRQGLNRRNQEDGSRINPFLKMIKSMGRHVHGDAYEKDQEMIVKLTTVLFASLQSMMGVCEEYD